MGHIVDVVGRRIYGGEIIVEDGRIKNIIECDVADDAPYYLPGFIDGHVHVESSMMLPVEFARIAVQHGSVGAICDPHEIANVLGCDGVELMLNSSEYAEFHFAFGVPSCVPACGTNIETSGARLNSGDVARLIQQPNLHFLGEMMNYPGVLDGDEEVMAKIRATLAAGKPVDGHAPGLLGEKRRQYAAAGITTDHECTTLDEGRDAVAVGMLVQIREGSAAKDYAALAPLIGEAPGRVMFCTDDSHPTDLIRGHIDRIVRRAISDGYDLMDILQAAVVVPVRHYGLNIGLLQKGDSADFICISDLTPYFRVMKTYVNGHKVFSSRSQYTAHMHTLHSTYNQLFALNEFPNNFHALPITAADIAYPTSTGDVDIIVALDGSLITHHERGERTTTKLVVYDRYTPGACPKVASVKGFGLVRGAFAQSIAHDCHNIVAIGTDDQLLVRVINRIVEMKGGIAATDGYVMCDLPLPVGGLMSPLSGHELAFRNRELEDVVRRAGCTMRAPFITLGFMALPVIPAIKLTDRGLFDSEHFNMITT